MSVPAFVDTNILVYADDRADPIKQQRARELIREILRERSGRVSLQVLQEYFAAATRKLKLDPALARRRVEIYSRLHVVRLEPVDLLGAIDLNRLYQFSIWDALILRAAIISGCVCSLLELRQDRKHLVGRNRHTERASDCRRAVADVDHRDIRQRCRDVVQGWRKCVAEPGHGDGLWKYRPDLVENPSAEDLVSKQPTQCSVGINAKHGEVGANRVTVCYGGDGDADLTVLLEQFRLPAESADPLLVMRGRRKRGGRWIRVKIDGVHLQLLIAIIVAIHLCLHDRTKLRA